MIRALFVRRWGRCRHGYTSSGVRLKIVGPSAQSLSGRRGRPSSRGFFPENLNFESWVTRLAALEAVLGLLIEISFIATFTQRFFNSR